jgi:hypothetical protein
MELVVVINFNQAMTVASLVIPSKIKIVFLCTEITVIVRYALTTHNVHGGRNLQRMTVDLVFPFPQNDGGQPIVPVHPVHRILQRVAIFRHPYNTIFRHPYNTISRCLRVTPLTLGYLKCVKHNLSKSILHL